MTETEAVHIQHLERFEFVRADGEFVLTEGKTLDKTNAIVNGDNF